jgi:hypothetical protein
VKFLEIKRHLNKPDESYLCDLLKRGDGCILLKYISEKAGRVGPVAFAPGTVTYAYYQTGSGYVLWKMCAPDGRLRGHLFHLCRDQKVGEDRVEYLDMLLDVWIDVDGQAMVLDRDEVEACASDGIIGEEDLAWIARQEREILEQGKSIIAALETL